MDLSISQSKMHKQKTGPVTMNTNHQTSKLPYHIRLDSHVWEEIFTYHT